MSVHAHPGTGRAKDTEPAAHEVRPAAADQCHQAPLSFRVNPSAVSTGVVRRSAGAADSLGGTRVAASTLEVLRRRQGRGRALPEALAQPLSEHFNVDLSNVRVHADAEAAEVSRSLQATAFTHGNDVYFGDGAYRPDSAGGRHLLAHELAHVAQNAAAGGSSSSGPTIGRADDPLEVQAEVTAHSALQHLRRSVDGANRPGPSGSGPTTSKTTSPEPIGPLLAPGRPAMWAALRRSGNQLGGKPIQAPESPAVADLRLLRSRAAETRLNPNTHASTLVIRRYEASSKQERELTGKIRVWWEIDGDDLSDEVERVKKWCTTHAEALDLVRTLTLKQFDMARDTYKNSAEAVLAKGSFEELRNSGPAAPAPSLAGGTKDAKPQDQYKKAKKQLRDRKFVGNVTEDDLATITTAAGQAGQSWEIAVTDFIRNRQEAQNSATLSAARTAKYVGAKVVGDGLFQQGLVKNVWDAAYGLAVNGSSGANPMLTLGTAFDQPIVLEAVRIWRSNRSLVARLVENLHVPGGRSPIQHKGQRPDNPDPTRAFQADFISEWGGTVINVHVDVNTSSMR